jgi:hypothetical protein
LKPKTKEKEPQSNNNEDIVHRYFRLIQNKDVQGLLHLFDYDAVIYEPFSKVSGLKGRSAIEPFLKIAMMANSNMKRTIVIEKHHQQQERRQQGIDNSSNIKNDDDDHHPDIVSALVTFEKGDRVKSRFTFEIIEDETGEKKIRSLNIEFLA